MQTANTIIVLFLAIVFLIAGLSKASGSAAGLSGTRDVNVPDGLARLVGMLETLAALSLVVGFALENLDLQIYGLITIWIIMAGAIFFHFRANKSRTAFPAMLLLLITTFGIASIEVIMESRQLEILRAIVEEYVATEEPVGSRSIAERHSLGISSATIRNEMAVLEEAGLITQPHTSAGRIPTDKGYRLFVDKLAKIKPLSSAERRAIETFLEGANDLDDVVMRTVRLLAQVTKQVAVVQYPMIAKSKVRHIELLLLTSRRLMLVLITNTGRVEQRVLELPYSLAEHSLSDLKSKMNNLVFGKSMADVGNSLETLLEYLSREERTSAALIISNLIEMSLEKPEERVVLAGTANLTRSGSEVSNDIHGVLETLEEQVVLLRLLSDSGETMRVRIGSEQPEKSLKTTSLVTMGYGNHGNSLGALGVLGPTRMDYSTSMSAVQAVARYVGRF